MILRQRRENGDYCVHCEASKLRKVFLRLRASLLYPLGPRFAGDNRLMWCRLPLVQHHEGESGSNQVDIEHFGGRPYLFGIKNVRPFYPSITEIDSHSRPGLLQNERSDLYRDAPVIWTYRLSGPRAILNIVDTRCDLFNIHPRPEKCQIRCEWSQGNVRKNHFCV